MYVANRIINALIKIRKRPREKIVMGIVKTIMIGLTMAFKKDSVAANIIAVSGPSILTPGSKFAVTKMARVEITILKIKFICVTLIPQRYNENNKLIEIR